MPKIKLVSNVRDPKEEVHVGVWTRAVPMAQDFDGYRTMCGKLIKVSLVRPGPPTCEGCRKALGLDSQKEPPCDE